MDAVRLASFRVFRQIVHVNFTWPSNWASADGCGRRILLQPTSA
jgi:hypothetical protein